MNLIRKLSVVIAIALTFYGSDARADSIVLDWAEIGGDSDFGVWVVNFDPIQVDAFVSLETNGYFENPIDSVDSLIKGVIFLNVGSEWVRFAEIDSLEGPAGSIRALDRWSFFDVDFSAGSLSGISITYSNCCATAYHNMRPGTFFTFSVISVPEPGTLALLGIGLFGMALSRRKKQLT